MIRLHSILITSLLFLTVSGQWKNLETEFSENSVFQSIYFISTSKGFVVGSNGGEGVILNTIDSGISWSSAGINGYKSFNKVCFTDLSTGYTTGVDSENKGVLLKTIDAGKQWIPLKLPGNTVFPFYNIHFIDSQIGFVSDVHGTIYKTLDAGTTWSTLAVSSWGLGSTNALVFVDNTTGFTFGSQSQGGIKRTTDGGDSWKEVIHPSSQTLRAAHFIDLEHGWAVGDSGTILATKDAGVSWVKQPSGVFGKLLSVYFIDGDIGYIAGDAGTILKTSDAGANWDIQSSNSEKILNDIHPIDSDLVYATGNTVLLRTLNGGKDGLSSVSVQKKELQLDLYPNPSRGELILRSSENMRSITVLNSVGVIIYLKEVNSNAVKLSLQNQADGLYYMCIEFHNGDKALRTIVIN
jgi:photosystem II stability/assembly factor-like uncharacterized protein